ncbi:hypothetical protein K5X82_12755 [Halosquirtibacter xylanolyticus]|uniref:hypothetical protein n=1 Tax=Halosquirtibacter xylanolyticus TaxID=3374599 RepID=UPI00374A94F9|nr:hypothetical protein K5X82_12755 [Prolixibacteraceae bacterium]
MVKAIVTKKKSISSSSYKGPSHRVISHSPQVDKGTHKQQVNRDKFKQCSRLMKLTKKVWDEGFFSTHDRNRYRECFSYNMNYAFRWSGDKWMLDPTKILLSKRIPKFRSKDISIESNETEIFFSIEKEEIINDLSEGYAVFIDDNIEEVLVMDVHKSGDNLFTCFIPPFFKSRYFFLHLSLHRSFCVDNIASREVYDSVFLGKFKGLG